MLENPRVVESSLYGYSSLLTIGELHGPFPLNWYDIFHFGHETLIVLFLGFSSDKMVLESILVLTVLVDILQNDVMSS